MKSQGHLLTCMAALLACAVAASAHQPYESSAVARLAGEEVELTVTTSAEIAGRFVGEPLGDTVALEKHRQQLLEAGAELYEVTASGKRLQPERVFLSFKGGEAVFSVIYPSASADELRFRAAYMDRLPPGYGGSIEVFDEAGRLLGREPLLKKGETKDALSVNVSATASKPVGTPVSLEAPAAAVEPSWFHAESAQTDVTSAGEACLPAVAGGCAVLLLAVGVVWRVRRTRN